MISLPFRVILVFVVHIHSLSNQIPPECESCGCCVDTKCERDVCTGCIDGYGGYRCYKNCPKDCVTCQQHPWQECKTCADEQYLNTDKRCVDCPDRCKQCTSQAECQECNFPYHNDDMITDCSLSCPRNCLCEILGVCSSCREGYYNPSNECLDSCSDTCTTCTDKTHCQSCQPSYSGDVCCIQYGHCLNCLSSTVCGICTGGYYGGKCNLTCSNTCQTVNQELLCEKTTGFCKSCDAGAYGNYCNKNCSENCIKKRCNTGNGHCTEGCLDGFDGPTCSDKICLDRTTVIGTSTGVCLAIVSVVIVLAFVSVRRWKMKQLQKHQEPANIATYVNTMQTSSSDAVDICVINEQIDRSDYEKLNERNATSNDEYDQIKSVNQSIESN